LIFQQMYMYPCYEYLLPSFPAIICWQLPHHWRQDVQAVSVLCIKISPSTNTGKYWAIPNTSVVLTLSDPLTAQHLQFKFQTRRWMQLQLRVNFLIDQATPSQRSLLVFWRCHNYCKLSVTIFQRIWK